MIGESWVSDCPGDAFTLNWYVCQVGLEVIEGKLYLSVGLGFTEIELEKVALIPSIFFDESKEHKIYVSNGSTYTRLNIDV